MVALACGDTLRRFGLRVQRSVRSRPRRARFFTGWRRLQVVRSAVKPSLRPTDSLEAFLDGVGLDLHDLRLVERAALGREHDLACYLSIRRRRRVDERVPADVGRWAERLQDLEHGHAGLHLRDLVEADVLA